jgi:hypothetical protein
LLATTSPGMPRLLSLNDNRKFDRATVDAAFPRTPCLT